MAETRGATRTSPRPAPFGLAGSVQTGKYVAMGGQVGVAGHFKIGDHAQLAAKSGVMRDLPGHTQYGGQPAIPLNQAVRNYLAVSRLSDLMQQVKKLQKQVEALEAQQRTSDNNGAKESAD